MFLWKAILLLVRDNLKYEFWSRKKSGRNFNETTENSGMCLIGRNNYVTVHFWKLFLRLCIIYGFQRKFSHSHPRRKNLSYSLTETSIAISFFRHIIVLFMHTQLIHVFFQRHVLRFSFPLFGRVELFDECNLILKSHQLSDRIKRIT